jgi:hypothetical protein
LVTFSKEFNNACKAFNFTSNDIIYIEYDPKEGKLRFQKNNGPERYDMNVAQLPPGNNYHPCVNLVAIGDAVELVYSGLELS